MTKFALLGVAALLSATAAMPAAAQEVVYNPGYCAQFYPNANCQNKRANSPYTGEYPAAYPASWCLCLGDQPLRDGRRLLRRPRRPALRLLLIASRHAGRDRPAVTPWRFRFP